MADQVGTEQQVSGEDEIAEILRQDGLVAGRLLPEPSAVALEGPWAERSRACESASPVHCRRREVVAASARRTILAAAGMRAPGRLSDNPPRSAAASHGSEPAIGGSAR
jgi:hypothetical protein